jgi:hypothetical protein
MIVSVALVSFLFYKYMRTFKFYPLNRVGSFNACILHKKNKNARIEKMGENELLIRQ